MPGEDLETYKLALLCLAKFAVRLHEEVLSHEPEGAADRLRDHGTAD